MVSNISLVLPPSSIKLNMFETLPDEIIQDQIACYLSPKSGLSARLVNRRFAVLFGDNHVWRVYYRALGLKTPEILPHATGGFSFSNLAKRFPFWEALQKSIDSAVEYAGPSNYSQKIPRSLCIVALTTPELFPLHDFAIKMLKKCCRVPADLAADELVLRVARDDRGFQVHEGARILALRSFSERAAEPIVREALLSIVTTPYTYGESSFQAICSEAVKGLVPYLPDPEIEHAILIGLQQHGPYAVREALDILLLRPEFLNATIDQFARRFWGLREIICNHLNNPFVVEQLMLRLSPAIHFHIVGELADALSIIADQESVQLALCQKLVDPRIDDRAKWALERSLYTAPLTQNIIDTYGASLPNLQELTEARNKFANHQELFAAMLSPNKSIRAAAAIVLVPLVPDNPDVQSIFLEHIHFKDCNRISAAAISALAKVEFRPFVDKPEVRETFLNRLRSDESLGVRCALIDILSTQLANEDVRALFLEAAQDNLCRAFYHSGKGWQIAAIDKLGSIVNRQEVKECLLQLFSESTHAVKAACIRALCSDPQRPLLKPSKIFTACVDDSREVREEAHRILALWVTHQQ